MKTKIMIVEDDSSMDERIRQSLAFDDYDILPSVTAHDAVLRALTGDLPDLVLMEMHLNRNTEGSDLSATIENDFDFPLIFLASKKEEQTPEFTALAQSFGFLIKPFTDLNLLCKIETMLYNHKIERKLKASDEKQRLFLETVHDVIFIMDTKGMLTYVSPSSERVIGYKPEEVIGQCFSKYVYPDDLPDMMARFGMTMSGEIEPAESRLVKKNGEVRWVYGSGKPIFKNDKVVGILGIFNDITEYRLAVDALRASEVQYRRLFESAKDGILVLDATTGIIVDVNPFLENLLGYSHEYFIGKNVWELGFLKDVTPSYERFIELQKQEYIRYEDLPLVGIEGRHIEVEFVSNVYFVGHKKVIQCNIRDISERKLTEAALRDSEEKFRNTIQQASDGVLICDEQGNIAEWNRGMEVIFGMSRERAIGMPLWEFQFGILPRNMQNEETRRQLERIFFQLKQKNSLDKVFNKRNEMEVVGANGEIKSIEMVVYTIKLQRGTLFASIARDITPRRKAEAVVRSSEVRYRRLFESAKDGILILDAGTGTIIDVNPFLANILGYSREEFIGKKVWELGFLKDITPNYDKFLELQLQEYIRYEDLPLETSDGKKIDVEFVSNVYLVDQQKIIQCNIRDITERKISDAALRASEEKFRNYIELAPDGVFIVDNTGRYIEVNKSACRIMGYSKEELLSMAIQDMLSAESLGTGSVHFNKLIESGVSNSDLWIRCKDGSSRCITIDAVKLAETRILGFCKDITERKNNEEELEKYHEHLEELVATRTAELEISKQAAMTANRAKSMFLSSMSHEIRTPLNIILGFAQLILRDPSISSQHKEQLDTINQSGEHLLKLINDILEFSKIESGHHLTFKSKTLDFRLLLTELKAMFQEKIDQKNLVLLIEFSDDLPKYILSDDIKLRQIVINLLGNAVKFTTEGGITVRARVDRKETDKMNLVVEVEDTGCGIGEADIENIFRLFEQTESGARTGGTGLGLTLSREYAKLMDGDITVRSEPGKGSCFTLIVAIREAMVPAVEGTSPKRRVRALKSDCGLRKVLVVDDEKANRTLLAAFLVPIGFDVQDAADGREAIEKFEKWLPNLILMDMRMPVMNGYESLLRIKEKDHGADTKIIAVTASAFDEDKNKVLNWGADGYLRKPFKEQELFDCIQSVLGVQYLYQDAEAEKPTDEIITLIPESVAHIPVDIVAKIRKAAANLDYDLLNEQIEMITKMNPQLGEQLFRLLKAYKFDSLISLFAEKEESHE